MGYEIGRFKGEVDEELICPICSGVLEDPLQVLIVTKSNSLNSFFKSFVYVTFECFNNKAMFTVLA